MGNIDLIIDHRLYKIVHKYVGVDEDFEVGVSICHGVLTQRYAQSDKTARSGLLQ